MKELVLLGVIGCVLAAAVADELPVGSESVSVDGAATRDSEENTNPNTEVNDEQKDRESRLIALYSSSTQAVFVTYTTSALSTCFSATNTACKKRRKRAVGNSVIDGDIDRVVPDISASQDNDTWDTVGMQSSGAGSKRKPKKAFTVWSTLFSTYTVTTTSYFQGTTVSVSGVCSVSGLGSSCFG